MFVLVYIHDFCYPYMPCRVYTVYTAAIIWFIYVLVTFAQCKPWHYVKTCSAVIETTAGFFVQSEKALMHRNYLWRHANSTESLIKGLVDDYEGRFTFVLGKFKASNGKPKFSPHTMYVAHRYVEHESQYSCLLMYSLRVGKINDELVCMQRK